MSDDAAFRILSTSRTWRPRDLASAAQHEHRSRGQRVGNFRQMHKHLLADPMTSDIVDWDQNMARNSPWPWCFKCKNIVRAYGVENRDRPVVIVWARCHGTKTELRVEKPFRDIDHANPRWLADRIRHMVFFAT